MVWPNAGPGSKGEVSITLSEILIFIIITKSGVEILEKMGRSQSGNIIRP